MSVGNMVVLEIQKTNTSTSTNLHCVCKNKFRSVYCSPDSLQMFGCQPKKGSELKYWFALLHWEYLLYNKQLYMPTNQNMFSRGLKCTFKILAAVFYI